MGALLRNRDQPPLFLRAGWCEKIFDRGNRIGTSQWLCVVWKLGQGFAGETRRLESKAQQVIAALTMNTGIPPWGNVRTLQPCDSPSFPRSALARGLPSSLPR